MKKNTRRFAIILSLLLFAYTVVAARLFYWQVIQADTLEEAARNQSADSLMLPASRGEINSVDGFPLAANSISYLLYANPQVIENRSKTATLLSDALNIKQASVEAKLDNDLFWIKISDKVGNEKKEEIENLDIEGIGFQQINQRYYPEASMAAQVIGFVGKDENGANQGYFGVEGYHNRLLSGRSGRIYAIRDALGNPVLSDIREERKIDGRDITLTIDRSVQYFVENRLKAGIDRYEAEGGSVIIMKPKTGEILASASFPRFDPQKYADFSSDVYKNPVVSNLYEPGSTFKVLIAAAGLDAEVIRPDTTCNICGGPLQIGQYQIKTWNDEYNANTTMTEVIENSDNIGMVFIARKLGVDKVIDYLQKFGIHEPTGIDIQGEVAGSIRSRENWSPVDLATASFGQGISITPLQLITAVSSIANDGIMMTPFVTKKTETQDGEVVEIEPREKRRTVSRRAAKEATMMMVSAVEKGDSRWVQLDGYRVAGKTGTAQIPVAGRYDPDQTIASFVGFFPAQDPQIAMLVLVDKPQTSIYGSETAAPIFFEIARDIVNYYNIPKGY